MNRLFKSVPKYELVQVQIYMRLINLDNAKLVEQYKDDIYTHIIKRDDILINDILSKLKLFCENVYTKSQIVNR